jgi:hypothetical protein
MNQCTLHHIEERDRQRFNWIRTNVFLEPQESRQELREIVSREKRQFEEALCQFHSELDRCGNANVRSRTLWLLYQEFFRTISEYQVALSDVRTAAKRS